MLTRVPHLLTRDSQAFAKSQTIQRASQTSGVEQEERLLAESRDKEANFATALHELERELKQVRLELERVRAEKERGGQELLEAQKTAEVLEWDRKHLRVELRELKLREARLLADNNELEDENICLQKQTSSLRTSQIELETAKHEARRLQEEVDALHAQLDEHEALRRIAERQTQEALEALQSEREQKYALKKELDRRVSSDSLAQLTSFAGFAGLRLAGED